jgi:hypothetical protein
MRHCLPLLLLLVSTVWAQGGLEEARALLEAAKKSDGKKGFEYKADYMYYFEQGDSIVLRGTATVLHKEAVLEAAEMVYYRSRDLVEARAAHDSSGAVIGLPVLRRGDETLRGERILYDLESGRGAIQAGRIHRDKGYYAGQMIQTRTADEFHVHEGSYTTCDFPSPHFDFYSPRIKVLVDDLAIARPVYFRIKERRLFWIPFYVFSLGEDRRSGILTPAYGRRPLSFGSAVNEWEVRDLGYYIAPNDYWDATALVDLRQRSGWLGQLKLNYALRYRFNGRIDARLENRQSGSTAQRNWRINLNHSQQLGAEANIRASGTFQSNKSFGLDNSSSLDERLNRTLRSNISYSRRFRASGNSLSLNASQTKNLDAETYDTVLPEVSFRKGRKPVWGSERKREGDTPWYGRIYYDGSARLRNSERGSSRDTTETTSADLGLRVTAQYRPFSWININPSLDESWRDGNLRSRQMLGARSDRISTRVGFSQTIYGLFQPHIGPLAALRHVFKPALNLNYQAARQSSGGFLGVGGDSDAWKQTRRLDMRLDNTLWAKVQRGEEEHKVRLIQFNFSTAYDLGKEQRPLSDLVTSVSVEAGHYVNSRLSMRSEWYDEADHLHLQSPRQFEVRTSLDFSQRAGANARSAQRSSAPNRGSGLPSYETSDFGFESGLTGDIGERSRRRRLQLSHYYSRTRSNSSTNKRSWVRLGTGFGLGPKWNVDYSVNYSLRAPGVSLLDTQRVTSELLSLQRHFHDWTATLNIEPSRFHENRAFYFKAQFNDIPQIKLERGDARF